MGGIAVLLIFALAIEVAIAVAAANIWKDKGGDPVVGFLIGLFLGILGLILVAVLTPKTQVTGLSGGRAIGIEPTHRPPSGRTGAAPRGPGVAPHAPAAVRECPHCWEPMRRDGSVCPNCGRESSPWAWRSGRWYARDPSGRELALDEATWEWLDPNVLQQRAAARNVQYTVLVTGKGADPEAVVKALAEATGSSTSVARRMIRRVPSSVGYGMSPDRAFAIREAVERAGGTVQLNERPLANIPAGS